MLIIASFIVIPMVISLVKWAKARYATDAPKAKTEDIPAPESSFGVSLVLAVIVSALFVYAVCETFSFNPASRLMPALAIIPGLPLALWLVFRGFREFQNDFARDAQELWILGILVLYAVAVWAIGFSIPTVLLITWMLLMRAKMRIWTSLIYGGVVFAIVWLLFDLLRGDRPVGALLSLS